MSDTAANVLDDFEAQEALRKQRADDQADHIRELLEKKQGHGHKNVTENVLDEHREAQARREALERQREKERARRVQELLSRRKSDGSRHAEELAAQAELETGDDEAAQARVQADLKRIEQADEEYERELQQKLKELRARRAAALAKSKSDLSAESLRVAIAAEERRARERAARRKQNAQSRLQEQLAKFNEESRKLQGHLDNPDFQRKLALLRARRAKAMRDAQAEVDEADRDLEEERIAALLRARRDAEAKLAQELIEYQQEMAELMKMRGKMDNEEFQRKLKLLRERNRRARNKNKEVMDKIDQEERSIMDGIGPDLRRDFGIEDDGGDDEKDDTDDMRILSEEEIAAEQYFTQFKSLFLDAIDHLSENSIVDQMKPGMYLVPKYLNMNRPIKQSGTSFLHTAAWRRKPILCDFLLDYKCDTNLPNKQRVTPFHMICQQANKPNALEIIKAMLRNGADMYFQNRQGVDGLTMAQRCGVDLLNLDITATTNELDSLTESERQERADEAERIYTRLATLFLRLKEDGKQEHDILGLLQTHVKLVNQRFLDLNRPPDSNVLNTFLIYSVMALRINLVRQLLGESYDEGMVDVNKANAEGETPLHKACERALKPNGKAIISLLLLAGADRSLTTYVLGETPEDLMPNDELKEWLRNWQPTGKETFDVPQITQPKGPSTRRASVSEERKKNHSNLMKNLIKSLQKDHKLPHHDAGDDAKEAFSARLHVSRQRRKSHQLEEELDLHISEIFDDVDRKCDGVLTIEELLDFHRSIHGCTMRSEDVKKIVDTKGACTRANFLEYARLLNIACQRDDELSWDFHLLDLDNTSVLNPTIAKMLWNHHNFERDQTDFEAFSANKDNVDDISWKDFQEELMGIPNLPDYAIDL